MNHLNTKTYQRSLEVIGLAKAVSRELPVGFGFLTDQLRRASASVVLNLSEGCGKISAKERQRFFRIARSSVLEVAAILDVARMWGVLDEPLYAEGFDLCDHVSALIFRFR
jgi:four helix bundle protein